MIIQIGEVDIINTEHVLNIERKFSSIEVKFIKGGSKTVKFDTAGELGQAWHALRKDLGLDQ